MMQRFLPVGLIIGVFWNAGCKQNVEAPPLATVEPRVFGPNEIRPKLIFVGDWKPASRVFLNLQLEVAKPIIEGPATLTNAEVNEDFFPTITAVFFKDGEEMSRKEFPSERSC